MASSGSKPNAFGGFSASPSLDHLIAQDLARKLQLRSPFLDSDPTPSIENILLQSLTAIGSDSDADDDDDEVEPSGGGDEEGRRRRLVAREEAKLEKEVIKAIRAGDASQTLKPNSGQSVSVGDNSICVAVHEEPGSGYRVWEWHGHIMFFDDDSGFDSEYIYGNYFESLPEPKGKKVVEAEDAEEEEEEEEEPSDVFKLGGLKDLIADPKDAPVGRVLHRNSLNARSN